MTKETKKPEDNSASATSNFDDLLKALNEASDVELTDEPDEESEGAAEDEESDEKIAAAAAEAGGKPVMAKSEAAGDELVDATELVKSLMERADANSEVLAKAITSMTDALTKQGALIKSLHGEIAALKTQGRGRKSQVTILEKPDTGVLQKSEDTSPQAALAQFMAKAEAQFESGALSGKDFNTIDVCKRMGQPIPDDIIGRVMRG